MQLVKPVLAAGAIGDPAKISDLETLFGNAATAILGLAGIVLFIMLVVGGFKYLTSGGDPKGTGEAKSTLTYAIGGIVLIALSFLILQLIKTITGANVTQFKVVGP